METPEFNQDALRDYADLIISMALEYTPKVLLAVITLIAGLWLIRRVIRLVARGMQMRDVDPSLRGFISGVVRIVLKVLLIISIAQMVGIETTPFIAVLGAAGLAVGLALQGSLSNFAGGVLITSCRGFAIRDKNFSSPTVADLQSVTRTSL